MIALFGGSREQGGGGCSLNHGRCLFLLFLGGLSQDLFPFECLSRAFTGYKATRSSEVCRSRKLENIVCEGWQMSSCYAIPLKLIVFFLHCVSRCVWLCTSTRNCVQRRCERKLKTVENPPTDFLGTSKQSQARHRDMRAHASTAHKFRSVVWPGDHCAAPFERSLGMYHACATACMWAQCMLMRMLTHVYAHCDTTPRACNCAAIVAATHMKSWDAVYVRIC